MQYSKGLWTVFFFLQQLYLQPLGFPVIESSLCIADWKDSLSCDSSKCHKSRRKIKLQSWLWEIKFNMQKAVSMKVTNWISYTNYIKLLAKREQIVQKSSAQPLCSPSSFITKHIKMVQYESWCSKWLCFQYYMPSSNLQSQCKSTTTMQYLRMFIQHGHPYLTNPFGQDVSILWH